MGITTAEFYHIIVFTSTLVYYSMYGSVAKYMYTVYLYTSSHLLKKKKNETRYKNILSEKLSGI